MIGGSRLQVRLTLRDAASPHLISIVARLSETHRLTCAGNALCRGGRRGRGVNLGARYATPPIWSRRVPCPRCIWT